MLNADLIKGYELLLSKQQQQIAQQEQLIANMKSFIIKQYGYLPLHLQEKRTLSQEEINTMLNDIETTYNDHIEHMEL